MKSLLVAVLSLLLTPMAVSAADAAKYEEGVQYQLISPAVPTGDPATIEVVELFWYGCPHCFALAPLVHDWLKTKPNDVTFKLVPAIFSPQWSIHARAMYAAQALGVDDKLHRPLFDAIHVDHRKLTNEDELVAFAGEQGIDKAEFRKAFESPTVEARVKKAALLTREYGIDGVPSVIVNGKYRITAASAGGQDKILAIANFLIDKERAH
ncbi:MAG: thiol:disulfide interchange protein DsbA/DsbL [Gammaproteobacteria bacterium]|nr:thiol:disulfide interchange protein DsbA/DsbL [Gammaproteobacteria bacterium]